MLQISRTNGRLCLRALVLALLAMLTLAAGAQADAPTAGGGAPEGQETGAPGPGESQQPTGEGAWEGGQQPSQGAGGEGEVAPEAPAGETVGETVVEPPAETQPLPPSEPVEEAPAPPSEPVKEAPAGTLPLESTETTPPTVEKAEEPVQSKSTESTEEGASGGSPTRSSTLLPAAAASEPAVRIDPLAEQAPSGPPATAATITAQVAEVSGRGGTSRHVTPMRSAGSQAGRFRCELSALGGNMTDNCTVGWLSAPRDVISAPTSAAVTAVSSLVAATGSSSSGGGHGGSAVGGPPLTPAPGSASGGASGAATGAGGAGGSGAGVSTFLTLAGLLLLGAPRALRRLRFSFEPWLAGCFVLIPERPD